MKTIGILGGMSNQATAEYYRLINDAVSQRLGGWETAEVIISSVNFGNIERYVRTDSWEEAGTYLAEKAKGLEAAGVDLLVCVSNTMHRVSDEFTRGITVPFLHIVDPTGEAIRKAGFKRVGLLGTKPVMSADFLKQRYKEQFDIQVLVPSEEDQSMIDHVIFNELVKRLLTPESKAAYLSVVDRLKAQGAQGVILGCTEIFLLIGQADRPNFPMFDTTSLHVRAAVNMAFES